MISCNWRKEATKDQTLIDFEPLLKRKRRYTVIEALVSRARWFIDED